MSIASPLTRPSPFPRRVGIRIFTFEASSGFTRVTARWIAQPPTAAFVTRLRPGQLPGQAARQLPEQSTTLWVEPSSTGKPRRLGALRKPGYASWQKGGVENANGRLRRWLPRHLDIDEMSDEEIQDIVMTTNLTPRKCLGFLTPFQAISKELGKDVQIRFA